MSTNGPKPVPPGFRDTFIAHGYRQCEKNYGVSNAVLRQWIAACGGPALLAERRAVQETGRKAGGRSVDAGETK